MNRFGQNIGMAIAWTVATLPAFNRDLLAADDFQPLRTKITAIEPGAKGFASSQLTNTLLSMMADLGDASKTAGGLSYEQLDRKPNGEENKSGRKILATFAEILGTKDSSPEGIRAAISALLPDASVPGSKFTPKDVGVLECLAKEPLTSYAAEFSTGIHRMSQVYALLKQPVSIENGSVSFGPFPSGDAEITVLKIAESAGFPAGRIKAIKLALSAEPSDLRLCLILDLVRAQKPLSK